MAQQSGGEFASANPTKGEENAGFQERGIRAKISLNACRRLQHVQRPTPFHFSKNTPGFSSLGHRHVARGRRCGVTIVVNEILRALSSDNVTTPNGDTGEKPLMVQSWSCLRVAQAVVAVVEHGN